MKKLIALALLSVSSACYADWFSIATIADGSKLIGERGSLQVVGDAVAANFAYTNGLESERGPDMAASTSIAACQAGEGELAWMVAGNKAPTKVHWKSGGPLVTDLQGKTLCEGYAHYRNRHGAK